MQPMNYIGLDVQGASRPNLTSSVTTLSGSFVIGQILTVLIWMIGSQLV